jgi:bifunctional ADP-heptose synthase (sugar kinase/adenylyltransferase)
VLQGAAVHASAAIAKIVHIDRIVRRYRILHAKQPLLDVRRRAASENAADPVAELLIFSQRVPRDLIEGIIPGIAGADVRVGIDATVEACVGVGGGGKPIGITREAASNPFRIKNAISAMDHGLMP